jgi:hypothetical protein
LLLTLFPGLNGFRIKIQNQFKTWIWIEFKGNFQNFGSNHRCHWSLGSNNTWLEHGMLQPHSSPPSLFLLPSLTAALSSTDSPIIFGGFFLLSKISFSYFLRFFLATENKPYFQHLFFNRRMPSKISYFQWEWLIFDGFLPPNAA